MIRTQLVNHYAPARWVGALRDDARLTSVCLSHTSGLSREQRSLGRLKLSQRYPTSHGLGHHFQFKRSNVNLQEDIVAASRTACYASAPRVGGIKRWCASDVFLTEVCLSICRVHRA